MPWTKAARIQYQRSGLRYASDLTDASPETLKAQPRQSLPGSTSPISGC